MMYIFLLFCIYPQLVESKIVQPLNSKNCHPNQFRRVLAIGKGLSESDQIVVEQKLKQLNQQVSAQLRRPIRPKIALPLPLIKKKTSVTGGHRPTALRIPPVPRGLQTKPGILEVNQRVGISQFLYQGDMNLTPEQLELMVNANDRSRRMAQYTDDAAYKWGSVISYRINGTFSEDELRAIRNGLNFWQRNTCLSFRENGPEPYIEFIRAAGCWSSVGRLYYTDMQQISIGEGCGYDSTTIHEIAHALGFIHEQSRNDRDAHVIINSDNIWPDADYNFHKSGNARDYHGPYDFGSVMQYSSDSFAINSSIPSLYARNRLYQRTMDSDIPQFQDVLSVNLHYKCLDRCSSQVTCFHGGVPHPRNCNMCVCPPAYIGNYCENRSPGSGPQSRSGNCGKDLNARYLRQSENVTIGQRNLEANDPSICFIQIQANPNETIELKITSVDQPLRSNICFWHGAQIYIDDSPINNPYSFCSPADSPARQPIYSNGTIVIRSYSRYDIFKYSFEYRIV